MLEGEFFSSGNIMSNHKFMKSAMCTALLLTGAALAQEAAISGADFTNGKADAQLNAIGKQAAASGKTVVITAPAYWQAKAAAKVRAGAHGSPVSIRFSNGFYENVLVRTESAALKPAAVKPVAKATPLPEAKPKPEPKVVKAEPKPAARPLPKAVEAAPKPVPPPAPRAAAPVAMQPPMQQSPATVPPPAQPPHTNIVALPQVSQQPAVVPIPTSGANPTGVKPALPAAQAPSSGDARQRLLTSLNGGRPADGELHESQLQSGDQVYSDGDTLAVVRLEGLRRSLYWLTGPVDLQRVQYSPQGNGRYLVTGPIDPKAPAVHRVGGRRVVAAHLPAANDPARKRLEQQYNGGLPITASLSVGHCCRKIACWWMATPSWWRAAKATR
ncbi:MAG: hypothetical protein C4338_00155 [Rhodanobacteraceae bacterium]